MAVIRPAVIAMGVTQAWAIGQVVAGEGRLACLRLAGSRSRGSRLHSCVGSLQVVV